tara:strand:- start:214 stop:369 length:156 start_codon:yes stop_codon:yes gene_type:complete
MNPKDQNFILQDKTHIRFRKVGKGQPILLFHKSRNRLELNKLLLIGIEIAD